MLALVSDMRMKARKHSMRSQKQSRCLLRAWTGQVKPPVKQGHSASPRCRPRSWQALPVPPCRPSRP